MNRFDDVWPWIVIAVAALIFAGTLAAFGCALAGVIR